MASWGCPLIIDIKNLPVALHLTVTVYTIHRAFIKRHFIKITALTLTSKQKNKNNSHVIQSNTYHKVEINYENQTWRNRWVFKHLLNDDIEFAVGIKVGKLFHRAGAANEKFLSAADWSVFLRNFGKERCVLSCAAWQDILRISYIRSTKKLIVRIFVLKLRFFSI